MICLHVFEEFAQVCEQSTDFHFANLQQQFESIGQCVVDAKDWRVRKKAASDTESDKMSTKSATSSTSDDVGQNIVHSAYTVILHAQV